jgi:hypothetical protein
MEIATLVPDQGEMRGLMPDTTANITYPISRGTLTV